MTLYRNADGSLLRNDTGGLANDENCCCDGSCPCCYWGVQILRPSGTLLTVRQIATACALGSDFAWGRSEFICGNETFLMPTGAPVDGCLCTMDFDDDANLYGSDECDQESYTESALDVVCNYNPPGPGTGTETHIGTMSFREVISVRVCYDPCGTIDITISHKVYCQFGVRREDVPPPLVGTPFQDWVPYSTDLVLDATYVWSGVTCPNCESGFDIGPPTSYTPAASYSKTWGAAFMQSTYCTSPSSSSFTVVIPGSCAATGLKVIGGGTACECP